MNQVEHLCEYVRLTYPEANTKLTRPLREDGIWSLDVDLADRRLSVEWSPGTGFGVSSISDENFAEGPDEVFTSLEDAQMRISQLLTTGHRTSPPFAVLLSRLRQRRGITQSELASRLGVRQATISGIEHRDDVQVSTLRRIIDALGGCLEIFAVFGEARYRIVCSPEQRSIEATTEASERITVREVVIDVEPSFERLEEAGSLLKAKSAAEKIRSRRSIIEIPG